MDHSTELVLPAWVPGVRLSLDSLEASCIWVGEQGHMSICVVHVHSVLQMEVPVLTLNRRQASKLLGQVGSPWRLLGMGMGREGR